MPRKTKPEVFYRVEFLREVMSLTPERVWCWYPNEACLRTLKSARDIVRLRRDGRDTRPMRIVRVTEEVLREFEAQS